MLNDWIWQRSKENSCLAKRLLVIYYSIGWQYDMIQDGLQSFNNMVHVGEELKSKFKINWVPIGVDSSRTITCWSLGGQEVEDDRPIDKLHVGVEGQNKWDQYVATGRSWSKTGHPCGRTELMACGRTSANRWIPSVSWWSQATATEMPMRSHHINLDAIFCFCARVLFLPWFLFLVVSLI